MKMAYKRIVASDYEKISTLTPRTAIMTFTAQSNRCIWKMGKRLRGLGFVRVY